MIRHLWIPMRDGVRLAARVWLPADVDTAQPAILEYIPYRKNDGTAARDITLHAAFARAGYAAVRVDSRGSGDSEGIMLDEYHAVELDDGVQVLAWLAQQPWCDGNLAMIGKSWGGFNGLQIAALDPPELKAIVTVCSTDDRYADDVHYSGGSLLASEMLPWAATMLCYNARPQDPAVYGNDWRAAWFDRMERTPAYIGAWLEHQRRDAFWKHGSVIENPSAIRAAVLTVGGWSDPYRGAVLRLLAELDAPAKGLIGPWAHTYPHQAAPGPAMDFIGECLRWFDHHLRGIDNGANTLPALRAWMPDPAPFGSDIEERPGRWITEPSWPAPDIKPRTCALTGSALTLGAATAANSNRGSGTTPAAGSNGGSGSTPAVGSNSRSGSAPAVGSNDGSGSRTVGGSNGARAQLVSARTVGAAAGSVLQYGDLAGRPEDQAGDNGRSHTFTSAPLAERLEILGLPEVELTVSADRPCAQLAVRLCEVTADESARLVTTGVLNLTHRESHEFPAPLIPGEDYRVRVPLVATGHAFGPGSRIQLAISASYWPWLWPSPEPVTVALALDDAILRLPVRTPAPDRDGDPEPPPRPDPPSPLDSVEVPATKSVHWDAISHTQTVEITYSDGTTVDRTDGLTRTETELNRFTLTEGDPLSARVECERTDAIGRADWDTEIRTRSVMTCTATDYLVTNQLIALEHGEQVYTRTWTTTVPRDLT
ncbi:CocE/NonD family hydrolase [Nocardia sp. NPDC056100]|uniref:CocE/NonD family hydrolase n=1 Tax=Nocardia sp. NPDC056100 TaxID=3345712 RepID=UPI0035D9704A